jgi:hypothetical protein
MRAAATPRCSAAAFRRYVVAACIVFLTVPSSRAAFVAVPQQLISDPSVLRLARADALHIQYSAIAYNSSVADLPAFRLSLDARFPSLTLQQFEALFAVYSFGSSKSRVIYNSSATYHFSDFLPPLLQAVNTLHFHTQYGNYSLPDVLTGQESAALCQRTQLSINCWGFAYDVLLSSQTHKPMFTLSIAHSQVAWSVLTSPSFSAPLQSSDSTPDFFINATARYTGLIPGDYFLIFHDRCPPSPLPKLSSSTPVLPPQPVWRFPRPHRHLPRRRRVFRARRRWQQRTLPHHKLGHSIVCVAGRRVPVLRAAQRSQRLSAAAVSRSGRRLRPAQPRDFAAAARAQGLGQHDCSASVRGQPRIRRREAVRGERQRVRRARAARCAALTSCRYVWIADTGPFLFESATGRAALPESSFDEKHLLPQNLSSC